MIAVFFRILRDKRNAFIAYVLGAMATVEMYVALFPAIKNQADELNKLMEAYPKGLMEVFGFNSTDSLFSQVEAYMSTEYFSFFWPIMVVTMVIAFANLMVVTEIEKGTIELTLAQPISRIKLFLTRYLAGVVYFVLFDVISIYVIIPAAIFHHISYQPENYFAIAGISTLFGLSIFSLAAFFSAIFSEKGKAIAFSSAILLSMYVMYIVSTLDKKYQNIKYFSFFHYFQPSMVFGKNQIVDYSILIFSGFIVIFALLGALAFNRRDITT